jgi:hypothetical protein
MGYFHALAGVFIRLSGVFDKLGEELGTYTLSHTHKITFRWFEKQFLYV